MIDPPILPYIDHNGILTCTRCFRNIQSDKSLCLKCNTVGYCFEVESKPYNPPEQCDK